MGVRSNGKDDPLSARTGIAQNRIPLMVMSPVVLAFGILTIVQRRIGKGPMPIEGTGAVLLGVVFSVFAVVVFLLAWTQKPGDRA